MAALEKASSWMRHWPKHMLGAAVIAYYSAMNWLRPRGLLTGHRSQSERPKGTYWSSNLFIFTWAASKKAIAEVNAHWNLIHSLAKKDVLGRTFYMARRYEEHRRLEEMPPMNPGLYFGQLHTRIGFRTPREVSGSDFPSPKGHRQSPAG